MPRAEPLPAPRWRQDRSARPAPPHEQQLQLRGRRPAVSEVQPGPRLSSYERTLSQTPGRRPCAADALTTQRERAAEHESREHRPAERLSRRDPQVGGVR